jgi:ribose 5-phosphate isomerase A
MVLTSEFYLFLQACRQVLIILRVDLNLNCIKGGGACHLREKVLAELANTCVHDLLGMSQLLSPYCRFIVVADYRKNAEYLGTNVRTFSCIDASDKYRTDHPQFTPGVPIEVVPFAYAKVLQNLRHVLGSPTATLRMAKAKAGPVVSDNGNFVIDAPFPREIMMNPFPVRELLLLLHGYTKLQILQLLAKIKMLTGVVEVGLFCNMAQAAYFGNEVS